MIVISFLKLIYCYLFLSGSPRERMEADVIMSPVRRSLRLARKCGTGGPGSHGNYQVSSLNAEGWKSSTFLIRPFSNFDTHWSCFVHNVHITIIECIAALYLSCYWRINKLYHEGKVIMINFTSLPTLYPQQLATYNSSPSSLLCRC